MRQLTGSILNQRYELCRFVAAGGMADVYEAVDRASNSVVAVKVFRSGGDLPRFRTEAVLLAQLEHPSLVRILDTRDDGDQVYMVLEWHPSTLTERLGHGALPASEAHRVTAAVASALSYVHAHGVVHRDVKPSNILIAHDNTVRLGDFGVARLVGSSRLTVTGMTVGTPAYLAPEQLSNADVTPAADVYALGLIAIEMLSGRPAASGTPVEIAARRLSNRQPPPENIPSAWRELLERMTDRVPSQRPNAQQVADTLADPRFDRSGSLADDVTRSDRTLIAPAGYVSDQPTAITRADTSTADKPPYVRQPQVVPRLQRRRAAPALIAAVVAVILGIALAVAFRATDPDAPGTLADPGSAASDSAAPDATGSASPVTLVSEPPTAPTTVSGQPSQALTCAQLAERKEELERAKREVDRQHRDDKEAREQLKDDLKAQRQQLEQEKRAAGC